MRIMVPNDMYQYSILSALMDGVADSGTTVAKLLEQGDMGLGTFRHMDGEMVVLDGVVYQLKADGTVPLAPLDAIVPFASVTKFAPTLTFTSPISNKGDLMSLLASKLPNSGNLFVAIQLKATFKSLKARTVRPQGYPGQKLAELGKKQVVRTYKDITGTMVGFRSPPFSQGVSVAGEHIHFLSEDRKQGGHVLELEADDAEIAVALMARLKLDLPTSHDFNAAKLEPDVSGIKSIEG